MNLPDSPRAFYTGGVCHLLILYCIGLWSFVPVLRYIAHSPSAKAYHSCAILSTLWGWVIHTPCFTRSTWALWPIHCLYSTLGFLGSSVLSHSTTFTFTQPHQPQSCGRGQKRVISTPIWAVSAWAASAIHYCLRFICYASIFWSFSVLKFHQPYRHSHH